MTRPKRARSNSYARKTTTKRRKVTPSRKRRNTKRVAQYRSKKIALPKFGFLPDKVCCRLKATTEPFTLDPETGGQRILSTNMYWNTPFAGFRGRQPREWDEMIALYGKCHVIGAKISVTALAAGSSGDSVEVMWGMYTPRYGESIDDALPNGATYADVSEDHRLMKGGTRRVNYSSGDPKPVTMVKKWSAKKWSKCSDYINPAQDDGNAEVKYSTVAADCAAEYQSPVYIWLVNRTNRDSAALNFNASIEYICVFTDRVAIAPST